MSASRRRSARAGARVPASASRRRVANVGVVITQLRRRQPRRAARRRRARREPPHRLRRSPGQPQPVHGRRSTSPCSRPACSRPLPGDYAVVFDSASRAGAGTLHVPLLGERRDAARRCGSARRASPRASPFWSRPPTRARASTPSRSSRRSTASSRVRDSAAASSRSRPAASTRARIACAYASPTTRSRRTRRTSRASSPTRAGSPSTFRVRP